jgi:hypothetical protein
VTRKGAGRCPGKSNKVPGGKKYQEGFTKCPGGRGVVSGIPEVLCIEIARKREAVVGGGDRGQNFSPRTSYSPSVLFSDVTVWSESIS